MIEGIDDVRVVMNGNSKIILSAILAGMMFTISLSLKLSEFKILANQPLSIIGGVLTQIFGLPILTMGLILLIGPAPSIALGMIVIASCPGGNMSNVFTHFSKGDTAYSVSLTGISSLLSALVMPLSILFWAGLYGPTSQLMLELNIEVWPFIQQAALMLALPLFIGMLVASKFPKTALFLKRILTPVALIALVMIIVVGVKDNLTLALTVGASVLPIVIFHNLSAFGLGALVGRLMQMPDLRRRALTFEVGIQNTGIGLLILLSQFDGLGGAAVITAIWSIWHLVAGSVLVAVFRFQSTDRKTNNSNGRSHNV